MGVDVGRVFAGVLGVGAMLAGFAGAAAAPLVSVEPGMGGAVLILAFVVIVVGGVGSVRGAFVAALLVGVGGLGLFAMGETREALRSVYEDRVVPTAQLGAIRALQLKNRLDINIMLVSPTPEVIAERTGLMDANIAAITRNWDAYMATRQSAKEARSAAAFAAQRKTYVQEALAPVMAALRAGDAKEALRISVEKVRPMSGPMEKDIDDLVQMQIDEARRDYLDASARDTVVRNIAIGAMVAGPATPRPANPSPEGGEAEPVGDDDGEGDEREPERESESERELKSESERND